MIGKTLVVGATPNPSRYAFIATHELLNHGEEVILIGIKTGEIAGKEILDIRQKPLLSDIHTVTMYIGTRHQEEHIEYLLSLRPKRIIFNPGTENPSFAAMAREQKIQVENACTLVMLSTHQYA